jgi:hypothetical protein
MPTKKKSTGVSIEFATSECDKLHAVSGKSQIIGEFLDWLQNEQKVVLAKWNGDVYEEALNPIYQSIQEILAVYFNIDLNKVETERRALLDGIRAAHDSKGE